MPHELTELMELGARTEVELAPIGAADVGPALARSRALLRHQITSCVACGLRAGCTAPVPFAGPPAPVCAVVGEAPGNAEDKRGVPFVGASGKLLRALLRGAGIEPDEVMFFNTAACSPTGNRAPSEKEMLACRPNLEAQLGIARTRFVLLTGGTALKAFRADLKVTHVRGQVFVWMGKWIVMPILHPAAILRTRELKQPTAEDLAKWRNIIRGEVDPLMMLGDRCVRCGDVLDHYDPDGVPYCHKHWGRYGRSWEKERKRWTPPKTMPSLFNA